MWISTATEMPRRARLDAELVRRGLARSRDHAVDLVASGRVTVAGRPASKPATAVAPGETLAVTGADDDPGYASRGGYKLAGALAACEPAGLIVAGRRCLDAGASTGGFTDVLLRHGAAHVIAVDVGYGQLAWRLRTDPRVTVVDRTNVRTLAPGQLGEPLPSLVVADLSFISLRLVLPALVRCSTPDADLLVMVKPQFEIGRERLGSGGVVRDPELRAEAVRGIAAAAQELGLGARTVVASPLPGPAGNVEFFVWLQAGAEPLDDEQLDAAVAAAPAGRAGS